MSRIVSVWLPRWPIQRLLAAQAIDPPARPFDPERPLVLVVAGAGGPRLAVVNEAAQACGLAGGEPLADARAKTDALQIGEVDPAADDAALRRLTLWATRYTPTAAPSIAPWREADGADGFFLDIEGAAHLFGGEEKLIADLAARLGGFGIEARLAIAATPGAAWAAARFHPTPLCVLPAGAEAAALAALPVEALRLSAETRGALRRLGFKTIGALLDQPRAPFAARFPSELLRRLDQALGRSEEPLVPLLPPPLYHSLHYLLEPIGTAEAIVARAGRLLQTLLRVLARDDVGARALRLCLYRVDGAVEALDIGLTLPTRDADHLTRLIALKLEALAGVQDIDAGFGFEAVGLAVTRAEPLPPRQAELAVGAAADKDAASCAALVDALRQRLGPQRVRRFEAVASHLPERAETLPPIDGAAPAAWSAAEQARPLLLLPQAEPAEVTALVPEGPPRRFCWRGVTYDVAGAQGPERIANEWWRLPAAPAGTNAEPPLTRDYYLVEEQGGRRFWLYREGLYECETAAARWFVHGLFG